MKMQEWYFYKTPLLACCCESRSWNLDSSGESRMEKMKKILSSPLLKKKNVAKTFGVSLEDLLRRAPAGQEVPHIVKRICQYLQNHGITQEGIFRVNGNSKIVDKLKTSFDKTGDADLEDAGDLMAVASLLKLFLRELPDAVVPERFLLQFVSLHDEFKKNDQDLCPRLRELLHKLPAINFNLLQYLIKFLVEVSLHEATNKMTPLALGIVFGPNLFRVSSDAGGLMEQAVTNHLISKLIEDYDLYFKEIEPNQQKLFKSLAAWEENPLIKENSRSFSGKSPVPSPRRRKIKPVIETSSDGDGSSITIAGRIWDSNTFEIASTETKTNNRLSEYEGVTSQSSESVVESESEQTPTSALPSVISSLASELVEKTISEAVTQHLFGDNLEDNSDAENQEVHHPENSKLTTDTQFTSNIWLQQNGVTGEGSFSDQFLFNRDLNETNVVDIEEVASKEGAEGEKLLPVSRSKRQRHVSKNQEVFEDSGLESPGMGHPAKKAEIDNFDDETPAVVESHLLSAPTSSNTVELKSLNISKPANHKTQNSREGDNNTAREEGKANLEVEVNAMDVDVSEYSGLGHQPDTLTFMSPKFRRAPPPKNRRTPSRQSWRRSKSPEDKVEDIDSLKENLEDLEPASQYNHKHRQHHKKSSIHHHRPIYAEDVQEHDTSINQVSHPFLELHPKKVSPEESNHLATHKLPFVPPLDLSKLHEHGDGNEPIPADFGSSWLFTKIGGTEDESMLSPRSLKLKKKGGCSIEAPLSPSAFKYAYSLSKSLHLDSNLPPSPPAEQQAYMKFNTFKEEEAQAALVRHLTKKIQSYKRKIKQFEDKFEEEFGYKPSHSDKMSNTDMKKVVTDLSKIRKQLKQIREESREIRECSGRSSASLVSLTRSHPLDLGKAQGNGHKLSMEETLGFCNKRLEDRRKDADRGLEIPCMSRQQLSDEKIDVQKVLLHFESVHGRPTTREEKDLMRPLYDRYRHIKRILAKPASPKDPLTDLQPILEEHPMEFASIERRAAYKVQTSSEDTCDDETPVQDENLCEEMNGDIPDIKKAKKYLTKSLSFNLHELSVSELITEQQKTKIEKRDLRHLLREFENDFQKQNARKVQREDRHSMESVYLEYKQIKAKLRLLEALISKHDQHMTL